MGKRCFPIDETLDPPRSPHRRVEAGEVAKQAPKASAPEGSAGLLFIGDALRLSVRLAFRKALGARMLDKLLEDKSPSMRFWSA